MKKNFLLLSILVLIFLSTDGFGESFEVVNGESSSEKFADTKFIRLFDEAAAIKPDEPVVMNLDDVSGELGDELSDDDLSELEQTRSDDVSDELGDDLSDDEFSELEEMKAVPFDYYQLVMQWQPATCSNVTCRRPAAPKFSIHGLWAGSNTRRIGPCTGSRFVLQNVSRIRGQLDRNWPNIIFGNNPAIWSHEWNVHGTCFETRSFKILQYFRLTLNLFRRSNVLQALQAVGIRPVNGRRYTKGQIEAAIARRFRRPALRCNINRNYRQYQLQEVVLCFNRASQNINCPTRFSAANFCPQSLLWVATTSRVSEEAEVVINK